MTAIKVLRRGPQKGRRIRRVLCAKTAAEAVGPIERGCEIYGLTGGQFSLVDLMLHALEATGPADCVISTWTAASADIDFAFGLLSDGRIRSLRVSLRFQFSEQATGLRCRAPRAVWQ